jgi:hypothetical protein
MASTSAKILSGCGIGCVLLLILAAGLAWLGYSWVTETMDEVETAAQTTAQLAEAYGPVAEFVPPPTVPAARMEVFLAIRESLAEERDALAEPIESIVERGRDGGGLAVARAGFSLAPRMIAFAGARNQALLDHGMGRGEYLWIYWLSYHAWLGYPGDDSLLHEVMGEQRDGEGGVSVRFDGGPEPERITWELRRDVGTMLGNLEAAVAEQPELTSIREAVTAELAAIAANPARVPWEDGLPEVMADGLEPYRERLEATYSSATNPFELMEMH